MWVSRIKYRHDDCVTMPKVVKHQITALATPGSSYTKGEFIFSTGFLMLIGEETKKKAFIKELKKDSHVVKVEVNNDSQKRHTLTLRSESVSVSGRPPPHKDTPTFRSGRRSFGCLH